MATVNDYTRTTWQTGDVIDATKMNNIETQLDAVTDNARENGIAPVFSATKTYAVGEHVLYNGEVYRCKTAVASAGAWVANNWTKASLSEDLEGEVSELKSALSVMDHRANIVIESAGTKYIPYTVTNGHVYVMQNDTTKPCVVRTGLTNQGDTVQNVSDSFPAGNTLEFTATSDANYIRLYFPESGTGEVTINDTNTVLSVVQEKLEKTADDLYKILDEDKHIVANQAGIIYQAFEIKNGHTYTIKNNTNAACTVRTGNTTSTDTVQNVSDNLVGGASVQFVASADAKYVRYYFPTAATGTLVIYDNASRIIEIENNMLSDEYNSKGYPINRNVSGTVNGVSYSWNDDACSLSGTATALSFIVIFSDMNDIPKGMEKGKEYWALFDGNKSQMRIYPSFNGSSIDTSNPILITNTTTKFTIPSNVTGLEIWVAVANGVSVNETVHPYLENTWSNQELTKKVFALVNISGAKAGKTLVALGDSIFGNNATDGTGVTDFIAKYSGMKVINAAFGGTRMVKRSNDITVSRCSFDFENLVDAIINNSYSAQEQAIIDHPSDILPYYSDRLTQLENINWDEVNYITINYGTNDWEAGTSTDDYISAYETSLIKFLTEFPHIRVFIVTPAFRFWLDDQLQVIDDSNSRTFGNPAKNLPTFNESLTTVKDDLNLNIIDCYHIGINRYNWSNYFSQYDTTHPAVKGKELLGMHIAGQIIAN